MANMDFEFVDDEAGFIEAAREIAGADCIAVDLESDGFFRYPERVCLIQVAAGDRVYVIDATRVGGMERLGGAVGSPDVVTILHAGSHDVVSLDRDCALRVNGLFDTQLAAAFLGVKRLGLGAVLESELGVNIGKDKRIQRSDWSLRPLSEKALAYAADDVRYLSELRDALSERLDDLGRLDWVEEECERLSMMAYEAPDPEMAVFNVKGWRRLDGGELAILKALVDYREREALMAGRPHFRVIPDAALVELASRPGADPRTVRGLGKFGRGRLADRVREVIAAGMEAEPPVRPEPRRRHGPARRPEPEGVSDSRLQRLKDWRTDEGRRLGIDAALVWPMKSLKRLSRCPECADEEMEGGDVRRWQRREFEDDVRDALAWG